MKGTYDKYIDCAKTQGAVWANVCSVSDILFDPRVLLKCRYGCERYGKDHMCPSSEKTPPYEEFKGMLLRYEQFLFIAVKTPADGQKASLAVERLAMRDGLYLAFAMHDCALCERCAAETDEPCRHPYDARPPLLSAGIDVLATARRLGAPEMCWYAAVFIR
ncbi:MAG: DUF2284 domain-containing protein [Clostridia bacterium]|nr:DUF2284 domain-containing protein [Clostridia bacterium]